MSIEAPIYNGTCTSCRLGDVFSRVCSLCGAVFCAQCQLLRKPHSNLPDLNCACDPSLKKGWQELKDPPPDILTE